MSRPASVKAEVVEVQQGTDKSRLATPTGCAARPHQDVREGAPLGQQRQQPRALQREELAARHAHVLPGRRRHVLQVRHAVHELRGRKRQVAHAYNERLRHPGVATQPRCCSAGPWSCVHARRGAPGWRTGRSARAGARRCLSAAPATPPCLTLRLPLLRPARVLTLTLLLTPLPAAPCLLVLPRPPWPPWTLRRLQRWLRASMPGLLAWRPMRPQQCFAPGSVRWLRCLPSTRAA